MKPILPGFNVYTRRISTTNMPSAALSTRRANTYIGWPAYRSRSNRIIAQRTPDPRRSFTMEVEGKTFVERKEAGAALLKAIRHREFEAKNGDWRLAKIGAFDIVVTARFR